jgi:lycopene cyclase domain-containing protein
LSHLSYLLILAACLLGTLPLELVLGVHVYAQWRRLVATLLPVVIVFTAWDLYAIDRGLWGYDSHYLVGVILPGRLPLEELLFFVVIPICAVLTYEAVLVRRPAWAPA